jgi:hypothetical protein
MMRVKTFSLAQFAIPELLFSEYEIFLMIISCSNSPLAGAEVKKMWVYASLPHTPSWHSA